MVLAMGFVLVPFVVVLVGIALLVVSAIEARHHNKVRKAVRDEQEKQVEALLISYRQEGESRKKQAFFFARLGMVCLEFATAFQVHQDIRDALIDQEALQDCLFEETANLAKLELLEEQCIKTEQRLLDMSVDLAARSTEEVLSIIHTLKSIHDSALVDTLTLLSFLASATISPEEKLDILYKVDTTYMAQDQQVACLLAASYDWPTVTSELEKLTTTIALMRTFLTRYRTQALNLYN